MADREAGDGSGGTDARLRGEWRGADPRCSVEAPEARSGRRSASRSLKMSRMSASMRQGRR
jgi:hypothetical protein